MIRNKDRILPHHRVFIITKNLSCVPQLLSPEITEGGRRDLDEDVQLLKIAAVTNEVNGVARSSGQVIDLSNFPY